MSKIVCERLIRFDSLCWQWAKQQENLSLAVRELILKELASVQRGRPRKESSISNFQNNVEVV